MSTIKDPVGPQPNNVYWRRRLLVLLGVVVVIVVIVLLIVRPGGSAKPTANNTNTAHTPSAPATPAAITTCKTGVVDVEAVTDKLSYAPGVDPQLSLSITNTGAVPCTFEVGSNVQNYVITTGSQQIWSSKDCQKSPVALTKTLQPGVAVKSTPFAWDRTASSPSTCTVTNKKQVVANGASYHLAVTVNGVTSTKSVQFVLAK